MFARDSFLFVIYTTCLTGVTTVDLVDENCFSYTFDPNDGRKLILGTVHCGHYQECCATGCCSKTNTTYNTYLAVTVVVIVLVLLVIFGYFMYKMRNIRDRRRRNEQNIRHTATDLTEVHDVQPENTNELLSDYVRSGNINIIGSEPRVPSAPQEPITPPPSYDTALHLQPSDRVPSYEDAINERTKTFI